MSTPHRNSGACCPDPAVERADWVPPTPRRWSIWEIPGNLQCSIIGTCLSHEDLLAIARRDAQRILETDPDLSGARGEALRTLLYLFHQDALVRTLRSG